MASNTRVFNLSINGVQTAITNVNQLETTVQALEAQLNSATFGTAQFNQLQQDLQRARTALAQVQQSTQAAGNGANAAGQNAQKMGSQFQASFGIASLAAGDTGAALGRLQGGFNSVQSGLGVVSKGFGTLKGAIASTGIGILLIAFGALVTYFSKSQEAMNLLDRKTKALQAVFNLLTDAFAAAGKKLFAAITEPQKAFDDLNKTVNDTIDEALKPFKEILEGIINLDFDKIKKGVQGVGDNFQAGVNKVKAMGASIKQLGVDALDVAAKAEKIALSNQQIAREERALNVERANSRTQITQLKLITDDATKSLQVRTEAARSSFAIETSLINKSLSLQDRAIANLKAEQALKKNLNAEDFDALAELQTKRAETRKESLEKQAELTAKLSGFIQQQQATEQAAREKKKAADEKAAAELKALREKELADTSAAAAVEFDIRKRQLDAELAAAEKGSQEYLAVLKRQKALETEVALQAIDDKMAKAGAKEKAALVLQREAVVKAGNDAQTKLEADFQKERVQHAAADEADLAAVKVLGLQKGQEGYFAALVEQVNAEERVALSKLENTKENEAARTRIIAEAAAKRKEIEREATKPSDLGTSILKNIFGVADEDVASVKDALNQAASYATQVTTDLLANLSAARLKALDAQISEEQAIIDAAKAAADELTSQLDDSQGRIDDLESRLINTKGAERQRIIDQLAIERQRNAQIHAEKAKEDARAKQAEQQRLALEKQKTAEQEKQAKVQQTLNALAAVAAAISATKAAVDSISAIAAAGSGGKFGFDNVAYILAATAAIVGAGIAVKQAVKGFDKGGFTGGGFGAPDQSGYKVAGVVHENEYVVPKWMVTSPKFSNTIAQLETARLNGGVGYAAGGYAVPVSTSASGVDMSILVGMQQTIMAQQAQIADLATRPVTVRPSEFRNYENDTTAKITNKFVS